MPAETVDVIAKIGNLGFNAIMLLVLWQLWREFQAQNTFIREMLLQASKDREALAEATGAQLKRE